MSTGIVNSKRSTPTQGPKITEEHLAKLKTEANKFRVLIIGRANAGKTTILQKICGTTNNPDVYNHYGGMISAEKLEPTVERGHHDVESYMVFRSNPAFAFHDSRGFEAGGTDEFNKVKSFLFERSRAEKLSNQVHVLWYCIPMDDDRPITYAENKFFSELGTGKVPVVVVFTKCEALEIKAIEAQMDAGCDFDEAVERAKDDVDIKFKTIHKILEGMKYPPKAHLYLQELEKPENGCEGLVECTAEVLDSNTLKALLTSTQKNSMELAMKYSLRWGVQRLSG